VFEQAMCKYWDDLGKKIPFTTKDILHLYRKNSETEKDSEYKTFRFNPQTVEKQRVPTEFKYYQGKYLQYIKM
jgi:hypothetical protein